MTTAAVRAATQQDRAALSSILRARWGTGGIVSRGRVHDAARAAALVAVRGADIVGCATYVVGGAEAELLTLDALVENEGVGGALLEAVASAARAAGAQRLVLSTTNDNVRALAFYQRRGFTITALLAGAVDRARVVKPSIPLVGDSGIPVRDEIVLERALCSVPAL